MPAYNTKQVFVLEWHSSVKQMLHMFRRANLCFSNTYFWNDLQSSFCHIWCPEMFIKLFSSAETTATMKMMTALVMIGILPCSMITTQRQTPSTRGGWTWEPTITWTRWWTGRETASTGASSISKVGHARQFSPPIFTCKSSWEQSRVKLKFETSQLNYFEVV